MPWKFQCLEGDGTWMDFDTEANWFINDALSVRNFNTCEATANPNQSVVNYTVWSENIQQLCDGDADKLDYHNDYTSTNYTLNLKLMMRSQMNGLGTPCMVRGSWDEGEPLTGNRKLHEEPCKLFVWEEYLQAVKARRAFEAEMRSCQERAASSTRSPSNGHHAKAPPPVFGSQPGQVSD